MPSLLHPTPVRHRLHLLVLIAFATLMLGAPVAAHADTQLTADATTGEVTAIRAGTTRIVAWSRFDAATQRSRLVAQVGDRAPSDLPIPGFRARRVDASLGVSAGGSPVLVYSRCRPTSGSLPDEQRSGRCDVYLYSFNGGREQKVRSVSTQRYSELAPSYDRGWIAYTRIDGSRKGLYVSRRGASRGERIHRHVAHSTAIELKRHRIAYTYVPVQSDWFVRRITVNGNRGESVMRGGEGTDSFNYPARPALVDGRLFWSLHMAGYSPARDGLSLLRICVTVCRAVLKTDRLLTPGANTHSYSHGADATSDGDRIVYSARNGVFIADAPSPDFARSYVLR